VRLRATQIGTYQDTLEIRFARVSNNQLFSVTRTIKAIVGDPAGYALLLPTAPYVRRRRSDRQEISDGDVVGGVPPPRLTAIAWRFRLKPYKIPKNFRPILSLQPNRPDTGEDIVPTEIRSLFAKRLQLSSHANQFCMLLWLEEVSMECVVFCDLLNVRSFFILRDALRVYDVESVTLTRQGAYYK
jgi:helicase MOV-10